MNPSLTIFIAFCLGIFGGAFFCYWIKDGKDRVILLDNCNSIKSAQNTFVIAALVPYGMDIPAPTDDDPSATARVFTDATVQTALITYYQQTAQIP